MRNTKLVSVATVKPFCIGIALMLVMLVVVLILSPGAWAADNVRGIPAWTKAAWTTWNSWDGNNPGTVVGTIVIDKRKITVTYTGEVDFVELQGNGINYYLPRSTFRCQTVPNAPLGGNMIAIDGTVDPHSFTFSAPVKNPVMAIVSLGTPSYAVNYKFSAALKILIQGPEKYWGGGYDDLKILRRKTLRGTEGDGIIQFNGKFTSLNWTVGGREGWNGFTVGVPPPSPGDTRKIQKRE